MTNNVENIGLYLSPGREFVRPYIERELHGIDLLDATAGAVGFTVAVLAPGEDVPTCLTGDVAVLECPNVVGTGMSGLPMQIASAIAGGRFFHVKNADARISTIHAVDVAKAVKLVIGHPGRHVVTDGCDPTVSEFAEALAWRVNQRRIYTLKACCAKWLMDRCLFELCNTGMIADGRAFIEMFDFRPVAVTEYLRTHVYDDESL